VDQNPDPEYPDAGSAWFNPECMDVFRLLPSKTFYKRLMAVIAVTLIHVTDEASESFTGMHEEFLWQEK
jgi:hypothetical protein